MDEWNELIYQLSWDNYNKCRSKVQYEKVPTYKWNFCIEFTKRMTSSVLRPAEVDEMFAVCYASVYRRQITGGP
ncbi:hypothetical protein K040078D81_59280 [Blautia hominis]|uniref:Transposase n=1 Tax=Blautia hominis TaxID=2025493 RepID=A0ABQ0BK30_9FIRM